MKKNVFFVKRKKEIVDAEWEPIRVTEEAYRELVEQFKKQKRIRDARESMCNS